MARIIISIVSSQVGTLAGNLSIQYSQREFPSDLFVILETVGAQLIIGRNNNGVL